MDGNYEKILERIAKSASLPKEEIERKVEAKRAKLSGLISKEGAAQVIAAELGISFDNEKFKIDELLPGMRKVNVVGKVIKLFPVRSFTRNNEEHKVANFILADDTSNIKIVLWDVNHIDLIEKGQVKEDVVVEILGASMRENEIHLGSFSEFKLSKEVIENVKTERVVKSKSIVDFKVSDSVSARAYVVQAFDPRFFYVCPECKKKATPEGDKYNCAEHGAVTPEKRALINIVLDDGTGSIGSVLFHENLKLIGLTALEDESKLSFQKEDLLGKEMVFSGNVRMNSYFNKPEFIVDKVDEINVDELIAGLEA
jgi:replication factor A1